MRMFYCDRCKTTEVDWPRSPSVDEHGALMPAETTEQAHRRGHADMDALAAGTYWQSEG